MKFPSGDYQSNHLQSLWLSKISKIPRIALFLTKSSQKELDTRTAIEMWSNSLVSAHLTHPALINKVQVAVRVRSSSICLTDK